MTWEPEWQRLGYVNEPTFMHEMRLKKLREDKEVRGRRAKAVREQLSGAGSAAPPRQFGVVPNQFRDR